MPTDNRTLLISVVAGALAGSIVTIYLLRNPETVPGVARTNPTPSATTSSFTASSSHEEAVMKVVEASQPAVVSIVITKDVPVLEQYFEEVPNNPFGGFFGNQLDPYSLQVPRLRQNGTEKQEVGGGSGFLVSADGYIVTNKHVVAQEGAEYTVFTNDGQKYNAQVVARDPSNDIAILKISGTTFSFLEFETSNEARVGQSVVAIGNSLGEFRNTVSVGVVSGLARSIIAGDQAGQAERLDQVIQTDAAINPGNSGGPLVGLNGKVIGVNVAVALGSQNVGFALPAGTAANAVDQVKTQGKISRPFLGVRYVPVTPAVKESNKLTVDYGILIVRGDTRAELAVLPNSPAAKAGLVEGDIILQVDGQKLDDQTSLSALIAKKKVGDQITLTVLHQGQEKNVTITLEELQP